MPNPRGAQKTGGSTKRTAAASAAAADKQIKEAAANSNGSSGSSGGGGGAQVGAGASALDKNNDSSTKRTDPLDFTTLPVETLRKYRTHYKMQVPSATSWNGFLLRGPMGKKTHSFKNYHRSSKRELATAVKKHFSSVNVKETDVLVDFIYSVRRQDEAFKLQFE